MSLIKRSGCVSGIIFFGYAQSRENEKPNNFRMFESKKTYVIDQLMVLFNVKLAVVSYVCCNIFMNIMRLSTCTFYIKQEIAILLDLYS
jgi:hypothetical protein